MGPLILARALAGTGVPYAVKIHGSALEYTVKPHPRFLPAAREGLAAARGVLVGSRHTAESLWAALDEPGLRGQDAPRPAGRRRRPASRRASRTQAAAGLARLRDELEAAAAAPAAAPSGSSFDRSPAEAAAALRRARSRRATGSWPTSAS